MYFWDPIGISDDGTYESGCRYLSKFSTGNRVREAARRADLVLPFGFARAVGCCAYQALTLQYGTPVYADPVRSFM